MTGSNAASGTAFAALFVALCLATSTRAAGMHGSAAETTVRVGGTGAALGLMRLLGDAWSHQHPDRQVVVVPRLGTSGGIRAVLDGAIDIGLTGRPLNPGERARGARAAPLGRTPFVIVSGWATPVAGLTLDELAGVLRMDRAAWDDGTPVRVVFRPAADSDSKLLAAMSPAVRDALRTAMKRPGIRIAATDQDAVDEVERLPGAIGTSSLVLLLSERRNVKVLPVDGVMPTLPALVEGRYPWFKRIWVVTGPKTGPAARAFAEFLRTPEAAGIMTALGLLYEPASDHGDAPRP